MKFSVLMSVYYKDKSDYLDKALESVLINQSITPDEVVIVKDGPLTEQLEEIIEAYRYIFPSIVKTISLETNSGLGEALRVGLEHCSFDTIARMDSDDINHCLRFQKQIQYFSENLGVDLVGTNIAEFFLTPDSITSIRKVPETNLEIKKMVKRRNPINHVSVMFKKSAVLSAGSYMSMTFLEDYYLWVRMIAKGFNMVNINETLVYVRTGESMLIRRSNPECIKSWFDLQKKMKEYRLIGYMDFLVNMINIVGFTYTPIKIKKYVYKWFLRSKVTE